MADGVIDVLLVDDDAEARTSLRRLLTAYRDIAVVGEAVSGRQAVRMVGMLRPDVVLMDADMPGMDGFETTVEIMAKSAVPIIIISASEDSEEADKAFRAMEAGAVALVAMPSWTGETQGRREAEIVQTVRAMSEVRVVRRRQRRPQPTRMASPAGGPKGQRPTAPATQGNVDLIAIGASTGGPQVLQSILARLPRDFSAAVVVVQHITPDFQASFVGWLGQATGLPVHLAEDGQPIQRGHVYVAPHPWQMGVDRQRRITLRDDPPEAGLRPAVAYLFRSLATVAPRADDRRPADRHGPGRRRRTARAAQPRCHHDRPDRGDLDRARHARRGDPHRRRDVRPLPRRDRRSAGPDHVAERVRRPRGRPARLGGTHRGHTTAPRS